VSDLSIGCKLWVDFDGLPERRPVGGRLEHDGPLQRGSQLEEPRRLAELIDAIEPECVRPFLSERSLVAGEEERRLPRAACRLDLDQAFAAGGTEGEDVVAGAVAVLLGDPANLAGQIAALGLRQTAAFEFDDQRLARLAERPVPEVAFGGVELVDQAFEPLGPGRGVEIRRGRRVQIDEAGVGRMVALAA